uniref:Uncharacterized protein n=1 Tax=Anguilla anguilla TaxID=7936 RepID=A0A0E9PWW1_ANGAN
MPNLANPCPFRGYPILRLYNSRCEHHRDLA